MSKKDIDISDTLKNLFERVSTDEYKDEYKKALADGAGSVPEDWEKRAKERAEDFGKCVRRVLVAVDAAVGDGDQMNQVAILMSAVEEIMCRAHDGSLGDNETLVMRLYDALTKDSRNTMAEVAKQMALSMVKSGLAKFDMGDDNSPEEGDS